MQVNETPFQAGWWGQGLHDARPDLATYALYPYQDLPPLPFDMDGTFEWLERQPPHRENIAREKASENVGALQALRQNATTRNLALPAELLTFFGTPGLQRRVRSCTDCYLDLSPVCVPAPVPDGFLLRFLADSQGCVYWYVYQQPGNPDHCVLASTDFHGDETEAEQFGQSGPANIAFCESAFERFVCRFWLENEIWFAENRPLFPEAHRYLEHYRRKT